MWRLLLWMTCQRCVTGKRLWARISDPSTGKRRLCATSKVFLSFWQQWCLRPQFYRPLEMPRWSPEVELAADACAHGDAVGIGGWVRFGSQSPLWFSERFRVQDFLDLGLPMDSSANLDIVSYETLAQIALVLVFSSACVGGRMRITIPSWTDNSGTEAVCSKLSRRSCLWHFLRNVWLHLHGNPPSLLTPLTLLVSTTSWQTC